MKNKILSIIFAVLLIIPCFVLNASAATYCDISLGQDYQYLVHNGVNYTRFDSSMTEWEYDGAFDNVTYDIAEVKYVNYELSVNDIIITATIYLNDGSTISASYINENYSAEHETISKYANTYTVDFYFPDENQVDISSKDIFAEKTTLPYLSLQNYLRFDVNAYCMDDSIYVKKGVLISLNDEYYYIDFYELGINDPYTFNPENQPNLPAYKITNSNILTQLDNAKNEYNSDFIGFLGSDFTESIGIVLLFIAFGVFPLAALIVFLILSSRAKSPTYKKIFMAISITAAAELFVFAVTVVLLTVFK